MECCYYLSDQRLLHTALKGWQRQWHGLSLSIKRCVESQEEQYFCRGLRLDDEIKPLHHNALPDRSSDYDTLSGGRASQ